LEGSCQLYRNNIYWKFLGSYKEMGFISTNKIKPRTNKQWTFKELNLKT
jgi:hypothetical protein